MKHDTLLTGAGRQVTPNASSGYRTRPLALAVIAGTATLLAACNPGGGSAMGRASLDIEATRPVDSSTSARSLLPRNDGDTVILPVTNPDGTQAGELTLTSAWIVVRSIELELELEDDDDDDDDDDDIEVVGPFVVNLLKNEVTPSIPDLVLPQGRYDEIEFEYGPLLSTDLGMDGEPLMDQFPSLSNEYSLYLEGHYTSDNGPYSEIDFRLTYDEYDEFEVSGNNPSLGFEVDGTIDLVVAFQMANWFRFDDDDSNEHQVSFEDGITTVDAGTASERHVIFLDNDDSAGLNETVFNVIEENIEESAEYEEDDDDDDDDDDLDDDDDNDD